LGHEAGDALLVEASRRLVAAAGASGTVYRLGGDEFCVVSEPGAVAAAAIAGALESVATAGGRIVSGSVGAASWPAEAPSAREAMKLADERMYASKAAARAGRAA
jgi:diguanylate cyclase (GGDEF)-like protein